jgi:hypothetical protein
MTETEAYKKLNWPLEGELMAFVLPLSGSEQTDWIVYRCLNCTMKGLCRLEVYEPNCISCGRQNYPEFQ